MVSVWSGTAALTVAPVNAALILDQWRELHRVGEPDIAEPVLRHGSP